MFVSAFRASLASNARQVCTKQPSYITKSVFVKPWLSKGSIADIQLTKMHCKENGNNFVLDNQLTDGGEVVSIKRRPRFTPQKDILVLISVRG
jgi:hypothetical protein